MRKARGHRATGFTSLWNELPLRVRHQKRSGRHAYIRGVEPFHILAGPSDGTPGANRGSLYIPPPLPAEFEDAHCANATSEQLQLFFITENAHTSLPHTETTVWARDKLWQELCHDCPVKKKCFEWAHAYELWGIWAGTTEYDRKQARTDEEYLEYGRNRLAAGYVPYDEGEK